MQTKEWFIENIGKRIYRDEVSCECKDCVDIPKNGFIILDKNHAVSLFEYQNDYAEEGLFLNYRSEK